MLKQLKVIKSQRKNTDNVLIFKFNDKLFHSNIQ